MSTERWQRLNRIFDEATALAAHQRGAYLAAACEGDAALRAEAELLIQAHERAGDFIETPAIAIGAIWPERPHAVVPGQRFGAYRVLKEIARGGMGAVYLAERADGQFERRVALKVIRRGLDVDPMLRRFRAERQILASLEHPNIARLLDGGTSEEGEPFFAMEYIEGEPIDRYVQTHVLPIPRRLSLFLAVCDAVAYAHKHGIIHRDLKPANVLVTADGVPKLLDFGIAKALTPEAAGGTLSVTGFRLLTPEYASPEQVAGQTATVASDVYSLGVVLYELLTDTSPYHPRSRDPLDVADAVRTTTPVPPSAAKSTTGRRHLRGDLDTIVLAALRKEPQRRYPSVAELAADIRRHLDGLPINARRDSLRYRTAKFLKRNRAALGAASAAVLTTSLLAVLFAARASDEEPSLLSTGALAARDRVVVSRFTDQLGDTLLTAAITDAFRIDLAQSPNVRVLTPLQVRSALERMQHAGSYIPNDSVARDLAVREGAKAFVSGSLARVGGTWAITVELISAETGEALSSLRETADDSTGLIAAVGRSSRTLRRQLGESLRELRDMSGLDRATTASLPALRKYSQGVRSFVAGDRPRALALYREAIALDSGFATAHLAVASAYAAMDEPGRAYAAGAQALRYQDRLSFRERGILVAGDAYGRNDYNTTIREYQRLLEHYPNDVPVLNNLALVYRDIRRFAAAESLWHRALAADSTINVLYYGLHSAQVPQGKTHAGRATLDVLRRKFADDALLPTVDVQQAAAEQAWADAERLARANIARLEGDTLQLVDAYEQLAGIVMTRGGLADAEQHWRTQIQLATRTESFSRRLFGALQLGYLELRYRQRPAQARALVDSVVGLQPLETMLPGDRPYDRLARFYAEAGDAGKARALLAAASANNRALRKLWAPDSAWAAGVIALAQGQAVAAAGPLRFAADRHSCVICPLPDLIRAYEAAGQTEKARVTYRRYIATPWLWRYENDAVEGSMIARYRADEPHSTPRPVAEER